MNIFKLNIYQQCDDFIKHKPKDVHVVVVVVIENEDGNIVVVKEEGKRWIDQVTLAAILDTPDVIPSSIIITIYVIIVNTIPIQIIDDHDWW